MRTIFGLLLAFLVFSSCDDGDVITVDLDFDQELSFCNNNTESFIVYDLRSDPSESLSLSFPVANNEILFEEATLIDNPTELTINGSTVRFIYRTYNRDINDSSINGEFCDVIQPSDLIIQEDFESMSGTVEITATVVDDDNDGIPTAFEGADPNGDGDFSDSLDSDMDGIFDYLDDDDDNDNVLTESEIDNSDGDDDPTTNPMDTDEDGTPDYLDTDDDGDLILTIEEDANRNRNPLDDVSDNNGVLIPLFRSPIDDIQFPNQELRDDNAYTRTVTTRFIVRDVDIEILRTDFIDLGFLESTITVELDN